MADFHWPAAPGDGDEIGHGRRAAGRRPAQVEGVLARAGDQPADQQGLAFDAGGGHRPVAVAGSLGPVSARAPLERRVLHRLVCPDDRAGGQGDLVVARDDRHVGQPGLRRLLAELLAAPVHLVESGPAGGQPGREQPFQLVHRQLRLGGEHQVIGDPGVSPPGQVAGPPVRHVHVEIRPGLPPGGDVGGEHGGHAVFHLAGTPGVLRRHARRAVAVFELGGLVDRDARPDQVLLLAGDPRRRQRGQLRAQLLPVPLVGAQQALHPAPALVACRFGERPAVRLGPRCQRCHVIQRHAGASLLRQYPAQERPDLGVCPRFALRDVIYAGHRGRVVVVCFHKTANAARPPRITQL